MHTSLLIWTLGAMLSLAPGQASPDRLPTDVPQDHWAARAVAAVLHSGVMTAPNGRFSGHRIVTRNELIAVVARLARKLERHDWPDTVAVPVREGKRPAQWKTAPVSRYRLAAVITRIAPMAMAGLPRKPAKKPYDSDAIPKPPSLKGVSPSSPAYRELQYLAARRMVWSGSVLLKPGTQPVTGAEVSTALAQMISGLSGRQTDEPEETPVLSRPQVRPPTTAPARPATGQQRRG